MRTLLVSLSVLAAVPGFAAKLVCATHSDFAGRGRLITIAPLTDPCDALDGKTVSILDGANDASSLLYQAPVHITNMSTTVGKFSAYRYASTDGNFSLKGGWCGEEQRSVSVIHHNGSSWEAYLAECLYLP